ncbi:MAG: nuclear transport factor 2 family protein [Sphingomonadales bacterium]|nr:nuclear transport factor 2 family protein [Sphingomonadales bacterium]
MTTAQETIALIERYYAAFNAGDHGAMLACLSEDVAHDVNQGRRELSKAAFHAFLGRMENAYKEQLSDIVIMANADGTRAAAEFIVHGQYLVAEEGLPPARGQRYELPAGTFFEVADGLIRRVTVYYNLADWIAQVSE